MPRIARLVIGLGLTAFVFWLARPAAVLRAAAAADPLWLSLAVLLVVPDRALMAYRWVVLLRAVDPERHVPRRAILRLFFVSTFVGTFLPSIGGDAVRAFGLSRYRVAVADAAASVLMDRLLGVWSLVLMALLGLSLTNAGRSDGHGGYDTGILMALAMTMAVCVAAAVLLYSTSAATALKRLIARLPFAGPRRASERLLDATRRYARHHRVLAEVTIGSLGVQLLRVLQSYCIGRSLGMQVPLVTYFALVPIILVIFLVPVTINGLGTSQVAFVWLFGGVGVPSAQSFALSVLVISLGVIGNLPGGLLYAFGRAPTPAERRAAEADPPRLRR